MRSTIGFLGLGALGLPVATNLIDAGYDLTIYNRTAAKGDPLVARGARRVDSPVEAAVSGGIVVTLLWNGQALEEIVCTPGFLDGLGPDGIHLSMGTLSPTAAAKMAALHADVGASFVEAPIFGRPDDASNGRLWVATSGPSAAKARISDVLAAMGVMAAYDFGEAPGAAATMKLIGNFLLSSAYASMAEALAVGHASGLDRTAITDMLTATILPAPLYRVFGYMLSNGAPRVPGAIMQKDLELFRGAGEGAGVPTEISDFLAHRAASER